VCARRNLSLGPWRALQIYPYHLADYVSRIMRVSPFKYNSDLLYSVIKEEKSYDFLPNFTVNFPTLSMHFLIKIVPYFHGLKP